MGISSVLDSFRYVLSRIVSDCRLRLEKEVRQSKVCEKLLLLVSVDWEVFSDAREREKYSVPL